MLIMRYLQFLKLARVILLDRNLLVNEVHFQKTFETKVVAAPVDYVMNLGGWC